VQQEIRHAESALAMKKILVVEDSLLERKLLINVLAKNGVENEILQAGDGEEGLKIMEENFKDICLVLLDWQMPKVDGIAFMKKVVQVEEMKYTPIVLVTASSTDENKKQAREANPNLAGYVVKPYKPDTLLDAIKLFLE